MHEVLVNRLIGLSLPRQSVARLTGRPDMTLDVTLDVKQQHNDNNTRTAIYMHSHLQAELPTATATYIHSATLKQIYWASLNISLSVKVLTVSLFFFSFVVL